MLASKINKNQGFVFKTIGVNFGSYLAIRLERSGSFVALIRPYVNYRQFRMIFCSCPNECNGLH